MLRGAPDAQRGPVFLVGPFSRYLDPDEGPRLSGRAFLVGFRTDFVTCVGFGCGFAGVLALAGLRPAGARKL